MGLLAGLLVALALSSTAQAPSVVAINPVIVTAKANTSLTDRIDSFESNPDTPKLLRWRDAICPSINGLDKTQDEFIAERLRAVAKDVGAHVAGANCEVNLVVVISPNFQKTLKDIRRYGDGVLGLGATRLAHSGQLQRFLIDDQLPFHEFSMWQEGGSSQSPIQIDGWGHRTHPDVLTSTATLHAYDSRITPNYDTYFSRRVIVIDMKMFPHVDLQQMSGYVALLSLAQINPRSHVGEKTILQLSQVGATTDDQVKDLTGWDLTYLTALYKMDSSTSLGLQKALLADAMRAKFAHDEAGSSEAVAVATSAH